MRIMIATLVALLSLTGLASAQNLALVLSNGYYDNGTDVANISRRHQQLVRALEGQGYEVIGGQDLNRRETRQRIGDFADRITSADTVIAVLNGHVAHFGETSWLLPSDTDVSSATGLAFRAVDVSFIAQLLAQKPGETVLFVGESNRELVRIPQVEEGLARMNLPRGVMMISGAYDQVGDILTHSFLRRNVRVIDVLRADTGRLEIEGDIPASLELGSSRFVPPTPEEIENALGLSRNERRAIQQDLTDLGFNTRGVDGLFGNGTRTAVQSWQQRERLARTGYLNADQIARLRQQGDAARVQLRTNDRRYWSQTGANGTERGLQLYLQRYPNGQFANQARAELARMAVRTDEQSWATAVRINTDASYRAYLREFPNGVYKDIARTRIGAAPAVVNNAAKRVEDGLRLNSVSRLLIEQRVADLGYNPGRRDGNFDLASRQAFRAYQRDRNLPETGYITADMIRRLLLGQ